jgi:hypothetical protein
MINQKKSQNRTSRLKRLEKYKDITVEGYNGLIDRLSSLALVLLEFYSSMKEESEEEVLGE